MTPHPELMGPLELYIFLSMGGAQKIRGEGGGSDINVFLNKICLFRAPLLIMNNCFLSCHGTAWVALTN